MSPIDFDRRVQQQLDARRDPLDDADVCAFLDAHPEHLPGFANLRSTLQQLPATAAPRRRWRAPWLIAAAATLAIGVAFAIGRRPQPTPAPTPPSRIFAAELQEIRPRLHAAVQFSLHQPLLVTATTTFETYERQSLRR